MTFSDLYFTNNDWEKSTVLEVNTSTANKNEELTVFKTLCKYSDYEVVGFSANWVVLMVPDYVHKTRRINNGSIKNNWKGIFKIKTR